MWDGTCPDTLAPSYAHFTAKKVGEVAERQRRKKPRTLTLKLATILCQWLWKQWSIWARVVVYSFSELDHCLMDSTSEPLSHYYLLQKVTNFDIYNIYSLLFVLIPIYSIHVHNILTEKIYIIMLCEHADRGTFT